MRKAIVAAFDRCHAHGNEPNVHLMVGHPEERWEDITQTAALIVRIRLGTVNFSALTPLFGTPSAKDEAAY